MKIKKWLAAPLVLLLIVLTGCQAVGGLDVNKALLGSIDVKSSESRSTISLHLEPAAGITAGDKEIIDLINSISLSFDEVKAQSQEVASAKGVLAVQDVRLPFEMAVDTQGVTVLVEGAKKPLYIPMTQDPMLAELGLNQKEFQEQIVELVKDAAGLFVEHAPNPSKITVQSVNEEVYGEKLQLTKLQAEISAEEAVKLVKPMLESLSKDETGLKELIGQVLEVASSVTASMGEEVTEGPLQQYRTDKQAGIDAAYAEVKTVLDELIQQYDAGVTLMYTQVPELKTVLGPNTKLSTELYFDNNLNIRKDRTELVVALPANQGVPISSASLVSENEIWNVNGAVTAAKIDTSAGVITLEDSSSTTPGNMLRNFDSNSYIYSLLKDTMKITQKYGYFYPEEEYGVINRNGTNLVSVRDLAYTFDADLKWDADAKAVLMTDDITGTVISLKNGAKEIIVDGQTIALPTPIYTDKNGDMYIPIRQGAQALGATLEIDEDGMMILERK
ncbi:copper amine oxidase N-terminal domain-containing protein [Paenibacillus sp. FSL K6-1230]|uniref:copper amine oxidase N-terminal domain-containing protein n=1 Tax=Paenibacillus sp. FSL K6-1230 TaxID=2921603 RepID=UPI0003A180EB